MRLGTSVWPLVVLACALGSMPPQVTGAQHVDIFQQFRDGSYREHERARAGLNGSEEELDDIRTEAPTSCVEDVLPSDPLELHEKLEQELEPPPVKPQNLPLPDLRDLFSQLTSGLFGANLFRIGNHVRALLTGIKGRVHSYVNDTIAKLEHQRHRAMTSMRHKMTELNDQIQQRFSDEFVEYRDVCLPDEDQCMRLLHTQIEQYEHRLRANVDQCHDRLAEALARQRQDMAKAQQQLQDGSLRKLEGCLDPDAGIGRSLLACTGGAMANLGKLITGALETFTSKMSQLSGSFARRVDKYDQCVVKRRKLLQQNERELSAMVKGCFERQRSKPDEFF
ncbi:uncharacterized protein LOC128721359 [Anopheles nili]|uniref:uncharacterized protein LOC128721359 n=1 Tax=Anopheles nili TaxID=185578 RepID=UPI00237A397D|nr:uncharacterized protein LOC128721359 [Anopheles nili]